MLPSCVAFVSCLRVLQVQAAAATVLDSSVKNVTSALKSVGVWANTVIIFTTDNGGPLDHSYNYPLRGGKHTYWEGGVRGECFVFSELLPPARRGTQWNGLAHASDWYTTIILGILGLPGSVLNGTGPVAVDGVDLWPALTLGGESPRAEVIVQAALPSVYNTTTAIRLGALKLIVGQPGDNRVLAMPPPPKELVPFGRSGGTVESGTDHCTAPGSKSKVAGPACATGCLFDVMQDPSESNDLASNPAYKTQLAAMKARLLEAAQDAMPPQFAFDPDSPQAAKQANQAQMDRICATTGFLEPGDIIPPLPPSPPGPPSPSPSPLPGKCKAVLASKCPLPQFKTYDACLACTREYANKPTCKPSDRQTYCHAIPPTV